MARDPILIAGGGIAGLSAALGFARAGHECLVLERSRHFAETGAGIQLGPNAVKALKWLGAWDALADHVFAPKRIVIRDGLSGGTLQNIALGASFERRFGELYRVAHRADLQGALLEAIATRSGIGLETAIEVTRWMSDQRGIRIEGAGGSVFRGQALIGADGIHSRVRQKLFGKDDTTPRGHALYRAMVPAFGGMSDDARESVCLWLCPGGHVVHYPVRGGTWLNIVAASEQATALPDADAPVRPDHVLAAFATACDGLRLVLALPNEWRAWPALDKPSRTGWSRDRMVLTGDAAHAALPYLAQGAAMALEDACTLGRFAGNCDAESFQKYERSRAARTARIQSASRRVGRIYHAAGLMRRARNVMLRSLPSQRFIERMAWVYDYDPVAR